MVNPAFLFLPLYIYPFNQSWDAVISSIAANPGLNYQIVVSPYLANQYPDLNYIAGLSSLNSFSNVQTLGYIHTTWAARDIEEVKREIDAYAGLSSYVDSDISMDGIFFDETPSRSSNETSEYLQNITTYAREAFSPSKAHIAFNPGVPVNESFYEIADTINIFENTYSAFNLTTLDVVDWDLLARSTYAIHSFTGDAEEHQDLISNLSDSNVGGFLITTETGYTSLSTLWLEFCDELAHYKRDEGEGDGDGDDDDGGERK